MKFKTVILITAGMFFINIILNGNAIAKGQDPSPEAVIEKTTFEFSPVIAGTEVTHRFSITNKGDTVLNIPGVYAG